MTANTDPTPDDPFDAAEPLLDLYRKATAPPAVPPFTPFIPLDALAAAISAAAAEAESLPAYDRPATPGELARWVKTRLYGYTPLSTDRMTDFLLAFARFQMRRPVGEVVNDWSRVPAGSVRSTLLAAEGSTVSDLGRIVPAFDSLLATDLPTGELLLLSEYAGQSVETLAVLTGREIADVRRELTAARAWMEDELDLPAGTVPAG